jgi:hypothetical protein
VPDFTEYVVFGERQRQGVEGSQVGSWGVRRKAVPPKLMGTIAKSRPTW